MTSLESILAKRRGYGTIVSYNVPPYGRAGLYLELFALKELVDEYRTAANGESRELGQAIYDTAERCGMLNDVPLLNELNDSELPDSVHQDGTLSLWVLQLSDYLGILQDRLFSSGLRYDTDEWSTDSYVNIVRSFVLLTLMCAFVFL